MIQTFTYNDVVRYAYDETSPEENTQIEGWLMQEPEVLEYYLDILDTKMALNNANFGPKAQSVRNILSYSANHVKSQIRAN